jgi:hypothetical protein
VGVADASAASKDVERLLAMTSVPGWVTEDALGHLGPSCTAAAAMLGVELTRMEVVDDVLEIDVQEVTRDEPRAPRILAYGLIGSFAEAATHVRETRVDGAVVLDVVTGVLPGDSAFASHGHLVRVRLVGP